MAYAGSEFCEACHTITDYLRHIADSQDTQDVIGITGACMTGIGDREGIA